MSGRRFRTSVSDKTGEEPARLPPTPKPLPFKINVPWWHWSRVVGWWRSRQEDKAARKRAKEDAARWHPIAMLRCSYHQGEPKKTYAEWHFYLYERGDASERRVDIEGPAIGTHFYTDRKWFTANYHEHPYYQSYVAAWEKGFLTNERIREVARTTVR